MSKAMFRTVSGNYIDLLEPDPCMIDIHDIAHGLSNICRFNGQTPEFYSVAQHSVLCYWLAKEKGYTPAERLACLLHDAAEAYVGDMVRPLKQHLAAFAFTEQGVDIAIATALNFDHRQHHALVRLVDLKALATEKHYLFPEDQTTWEGLESFDAADVPDWTCWLPDQACKAFLEHVRVAVIESEKSAAMAT